MAQLFTALIFAVLVLLAVGVAGLVAIRRYLGVRYHELGMAYILAGVLLAADLVVLVFSMAFTTSSAKIALRLRGGMIPNDLLQWLIERTGGDSLQLATLLGVVLPVITWLVAHVAVVAALIGCRYLVGAIVAGTQQAEEHGAVGLSRAGIAWTSTFAAFAVAGCFAWFFWVTAGLEAQLLQYQVIDSSKPLRDALGANWESTLGTREMAAKLGHTFLGQILIHVKQFYMIALFAVAFVVVLALHGLGRAIRAMPRGRPYRVMPLQLMPIHPDDPAYGMNTPAVAPPEHGPAASGAEPPEDPGPPPEPPGGRPSTGRGQELPPMPPPG